MIEDDDVHIDSVLPRNKMKMIMQSHLSMQ